MITEKVSIFNLRRNNPTFTAKQARFKILIDLNLVICVPVLTQEYYSVLKVCVFYRVFFVLFSANWIMAIDASVSLFIFIQYENCFDHNFIKRFCANNP